MPRSMPRVVDLTADKLAHQRPVTGFPNGTGLSYRDVEELLVRTGVSRSITSPSTAGCSGLAHCWPKPPGSAGTRPATGGSSTKRTSRSTGVALRVPGRPPVRAGHRRAGLCRCSRHRPPRCGVIGGSSGAICAYSASGQFEPSTHDRRDNRSSIKSRRHALTTTHQRARSRSHGPTQP
jgi:hypothetical protein